MNNLFDYKVIKDFILIKDKVNNILFDSNSLIISIINKTEPILKAITTFKNYKKQLQKEIKKNKYPNNKASEKEEKKLGICLLISNDCNLNCKYCYADGGSYTNTKGKMDNQVIDKTLKFISKNFNSQKNIFISFFGGEPLLFPKSIKYFIKRSKEVLPNVNFSFAMTTNGTILNDAIFSLLKNEKIDFQISLDGDKIIQDTLRRTINNQGSYDRILKNLKKFKKIKKNLSFRATITTKNLYVSKIYQHFKNLGAKKIQFEIVGIKSTNSLYLNDQSIKIYKIELNKLSKIYLEDFIKEKKTINLYNFSKFFKFIHLGIKKIRNCAIFDNLIAINFKGEIYPCHRFVGKKDFKLADISQNFDINNSREMIKNVDEHPSCKKCFARYLCGGGCYYNSLYSSDPKKLFFSPHCKIFRHTLSLAIWLYSNLIQSKKKDYFIDFFSLHSNKT